MKIIYNYRGLYIYINICIHKLYDDVIQWIYRSHYIIFEIKQQQQKLYCFISAIRIIERI